MSVHVRYSRFAVPKRVCIVACLLVIAMLYAVPAYSMSDGAFSTTRQEPVHEALVRMGPVRLRDTVRLPEERILRERLRPQFDGILHFQDHNGRSLIAALMCKERTVLSVANTVCMVLDDYHRWQCENVSRDSKPISYRKRSDLIKLILADRPDAIALLDKMQVFKHDEPEEMKE